MHNDFEQVKDALNLQKVITQETSLKMKGHHLEECPFCGGHECFSLKEKGFKCFQCDTAGDVFTFLEEYLKIDKFEALKKAAQIAGVTISSQGRQEVKLFTKDKIFNEASTYYHSHYIGNKNGANKYFIDTRGQNGTVLKNMRVGWTDGGLVDHLRSKGFSDSDIKASGLSKEIDKDDQKLLVDYFVKCVAIFPHFDKTRTLHFTIKDPAKKYKYQLENKHRNKDWRFYNQDALGKYNEIISVEGENDLLSVMSAGAQNVIAFIGSLADYQIKALKTHCTHKHLYLWLDNDKAGKDYIRKLCASLKSNVRIITYPNTFKDPDEYLREFDGDRRKEVKRLQEEAIDYISWEIIEISKLDDQEERLKALKDRKIFTAVADMVEIEKEVYVEKLIALRFSRGAIEQQIDVNHDLRQTIGEYMGALHSKKDADPNKLATIMFKSMSESGRFYRDRYDVVYLMYHHHIYQIGTNRPFNALMKKLTGLLPTREPGRSVWESLASEAYNNGMQINLASWIQSDILNDYIYVNLNSPNNIILKISKTGIEEIPNGMNQEGILLKSSSKIMPVNFHPDADIQEGFTLLKELVFDNMTCPKEQRYLILCWFLSAFLVDFSPYGGLMKFSGASGCGKTTTAKLLSLLIYGDEQLGDPSAAAAYATASQNPLLIIDNLENDDFTKSIMKFLLLSATKGSKEKRRGGTESDTTLEKPKALVLITAIEPFVRSELINRTYDVDFSFKFKSDGFVENEAIRQLMKKRNIIMSAIIKFINKDVLPHLEKRRDYITILKKEHKNHAKNRTDEYLALLMLMLEKLIEYIPYYDEDEFLRGIPDENSTAAKEIRTAWIEEQNSKARETESSSNNIIQLLDGLIREYTAYMKGSEPIEYGQYKDKVFVATHPDYLLEVIKTKPETICAKCKKPREAELQFDQEIDYCVCTDAQSGEIYLRTFFEFIATSSEIVAAFSRYCRNTGIRNSFEKASILGARIRNDLPLLKRNGWDLITKDSDSDRIFFRKIQGNRFYKFRKTLVR